MSHPLTKNRIPLILFALTLAACSGNKLTIETAPRQKPQGNAVPGGSDPDGKTDQPKVETSVAITTSGGSFQLKNATLLRRSIESCFGRDMTAIKTDMIMSVTGPAVPAGSDGRVKFLLPSYKDGDDIIEAERPSLVDPDAGARAAVAADGLTATYLRSLAIIGDVVAHNCSAANPNCACDTEAAALAMITRCVPAIDPKTQQAADASLMISSVCSSGESGMRRAVSSLISSYAFGLGR